MTGVASGHLNEWAVIDNIFDMTTSAFKAL
jgi:hypothetical protein